MGTGAAERGKGTSGRRAAPSPPRRAEPPAQQRRRARAARPRPAAASPEQRQEGGGLHVGQLDLGRGGGHPAVEHRVEHGAAGRQDEAVGGDALLAGPGRRSPAPAAGAALAHHEVHVAEELVGEQEGEALPQRALGGLPVVQRLPLQHRAGLRGGGTGGGAGGRGGGAWRLNRGTRAAGRRHRRAAGPDRAAGSAGNTRGPAARPTSPRSAPAPRMRRRRSRAGGGAAAARPPVPAGSAAAWRRVRSVGRVRRECAHRAANGANRACEAQSTELCIVTLGNPCISRLLLGT